MQSFQLERILRTAQTDSTCWDGIYLRHQQLYHAFKNYKSTGTQPNLFTVRMMSV